MHGRLAIMLALLAAAASTNAFAQSCANHLFVSGYFSNNVAIYDACSGAFLRQLETAGRIEGAQAVRLNPADGLIHVVSEGNGQIQRYRHDATYAFVDVFAQLAPDFHPTGIAFGPGGEVYVASYGQSRVAELDPETGLEIATTLPSDSGLQGADNGMMVSASGRLYVPGYDSSTVARVDLASGTIDGDFVAEGTNGLFETRGIVDEGATILVGGEGSGAIYRFDAETGAAIGPPLITGLNRPTGMTIDDDGTLLVFAGNRVRRYDRASGAMIEIVANGIDGGISGGTFIALIPNPANDSVFANGFDPGT
jgi:DNA-binding beta-propeller fold protein YncE